MSVTALNSNSKITPGHLKKTAIFPNFSGEQMSIQISFASQGGSHTPTPDLSIEVDDVEGALEGMRRAGFPIEYGPADEPWGVRRFYVRDPFGKLVNILAHAESD
jgi:catechol 2,3-dioxygenase-like lactoylglutathione lyase family enzyme